VLTGKYENDYQFQNSPRSPPRDKGARKMTKFLSAGMGMGLAFLMGCGNTGLGTGDPSSTASSSSGAACEANVAYVPFDSSRGGALRDMVAAQAEIKARMKADGFAKENMPEIEEIYAATSGLAAAVQALGGVPSWEDSDVGSQLHAAITGAIDRGLDAQDTTALVELRQIIDKTLTRFFFLTVWQHTNASGSAEEQWDLAWAAYGRKDNGEDSGLAATVKSYDDEFGLSQNDAVLTQFSQVRCAVLGGNAQAQSAAAQAIHSEIRLALAYGVSKYLNRLALGTGSRGDLMEGAVYFNAVEPWMRANGKTAQADTIRNWLNPFLLDGAQSAEIPPTDGATAALNALEEAFSLAL
jgi:hypothetical protein